jgi:hypothetical protein
LKGNTTEYPGLASLLLGLAGGVLGLLFGALGGAGTDEIFQVEGMTSSEIQETLDKLRKNALIRDYK